MVAIACVQRLHDRDERLPYAIEVIGFADEEGLRFGTTYLGSSAYTGSFSGERLRLEDRSGVTLREAVRSFGGDPDALEGDGHSGEDLLGYFEVHIEQGPVLEKRTYRLAWSWRSTARVATRSALSATPDTRHGAHGRQAGRPLRSGRVRARGGSRR